MESCPVLLYKQCFVWLFSNESVKLKIQKTLKKIQLVQDDLNFPIVNFPFFCSTFPASPVYRVLCISIIAIFQGLCILSEYFATEKTADTDVNDS